ncbi:MAG: hypothetical protein ABFC12_08555 [Methanobacterium sp.]
MKEEKQEGNSKDKLSFTLTFANDELIEETWSLLKKCIENYRLHEDNGFHNETRIETKVTTLKDKYIKLRAIS